MVGSQGVVVVSSSRVVGTIGDGLYFLVERLIVKAPWLQLLVEWLVL